MKETKEIPGTAATIRKYFEKMAKTVMVCKDFIPAVVGANPYAGIAMTGLSLLLPLLLNSTQESEAAAKGLDSIGNLILIYRWREKAYLNDNDAKTDFIDTAKVVYTKILEWDASLLIHLEKSAPACFVNNLSQSGNLSSLVA